MNYFYQISSSICVGAISLALSLLIARQAGAMIFGQYSTAIAIGSILAIVFDGGMRSLLTRERTKASKNLTELHQVLPCIAMGYSLTLAILTSILCLIAFPNQLYLGLGIIWCFWGSVITQYASAILRGDGQLKKDSQWQLQQRILTALLIALAVMFGYFNAWQLLFIWAIGALLANLILKEGFRFKPVFKPLVAIKYNLYRTLLPLFWIDLATTIYFRSDLILLKSLNISDSDIGQYAAAFRLIEIAVLVASPISIIIFRRVRLLQDERLLQTKFIIKSLLISVIFGIMGLIFMKWIGVTLAQFIYGDQYTHAAALLPTLSWMIVLLIPNVVLAQCALALNLEKSYALTATLAAIANITLNTLFIPRYGITTAVYSSIATELILLIGLSIAIFQNLKIAYSAKRNIL